MTRKLTVGSLAVLLLASLLGTGCDSGGVGDPCTPEDEYQTAFNGFQVTEVNVESRSFQCETRLCLVNHFQGRVSCKLGQTAAEGASDAKCALPGTSPGPKGSVDNVTVAVPAQLVTRQTDQAVYCSCRCDGPDKNAKYCECPDGFSCTRLIDFSDPAFGSGQLEGSYCIKEGSAWEPKSEQKDSENCADSPAKCTKTK